MGLNEREKQAQELIIKEVEKALDLLQAHLHKYCKEVAPQFTGVEGKSVPIHYIDESIKLFKNAYRKGAEKNQN